MGRLHLVASRSSRAFRRDNAASLDEHRRPDRHAVIEVNHVLVQHSDAAGGGGLPDLPGLVGAVDAEEGIAAALVEVERARAERIIDPGRGVAWQVRNEFHHVRGGAPVRPHTLATDIGSSLPGEALTSDADRVAYGGVVALDEIKEALVDIDDDGAGPLPAKIAHRLSEVLRRQVSTVDEGY